MYIPKVIGRRSVSLIFPLLILSGLLAACSTPSVRLEKGDVSTSKIVKLKDLEKQETVNRVRAAVQKAEDLFAKAIDENVADYAPRHFDDVQRDVAELRDMYKDYDPNDTSFFGGPDEDDLFKQSGVVTNGLNNLFALKTMIASYMGDIIADKKYLDKLVISEFRDEYNDILDDIKSLMRDIESDESVKGYDDERFALSQRMRKLEVKLVKTRVMKTPLQAFHQLNSGKIPKSYNDAKLSLDTLAHQIEMHPRDNDVIETAQLAAMKMIKRAISISGEVDWIRGLARRDQEDIVLKYHSGLGHINKGILNADHSDLPFNEQVYAIKEAILIQQKKLLAESKQATTNELTAAFENEKASAISAALQTQKQAFEERLDVQKTSYLTQVSELQAENETLRNNLAEKEKPPEAGAQPVVTDEAPAENGNAENSAAETTPSEPASEPPADTPEENTSNDGATN